MANFINKIQVGTETYQIGMENTVHFDGLAAIGTWFSDESCTAKATITDLHSKDFLYYNAAAIGANSVVKGCMYLPTSDAEGKQASAYELVCIETGLGTGKNISKWAVLGEIYTQTGSAVTDVTTEDKSVIDAVTPTSAAFVKTVTAGKKDVHTTLSTASVTVITAAPASATLTTQTVNKGFKATSDTFNYVSSISSGSAVPVHVSTKAPITVSAAVTGGAAAPLTGSKSVTVKEYTATPTDVEITLTNGTAKSFVTKVNYTAPTVTTANITYDAANKALVFGQASYVTSVSAGSASGTTGTISVPTSAALASQVITGISSEDATKTITGVVTGVKYTDPTVTVSLPTQVVTGITYTAPTATTADQTVITAASASTETIYALPSTATPVTSISTSDKTIATGFTSEVLKVVTDVTAGTADAVTDVAATTTTVKSVKTVTSGTVVTAAQ